MAALTSGADTNRRIEHVLRRGIIRSWLVAVRNGRIEEGQAMTDAKELLSEDMIRQIEEAARSQNKKPGEVLREAWGRYMATHRLEWLAQRGEERARALGIREEDVPRLVGEVRRENKARGR